MILTNWCCLWVRIHLDRLLGFRKCGCKIVSVPTGQILFPVHLSRGDRIQFPFHLGRKVGTDQLRQHLTQKLIDFHSQLSRNKYTFLQANIIPLFKRLDSWRIGAGTANSLFLHQLNQLGLRIAGWWNSLLFISSSLLTG